MLLRSWLYGKINITLDIPEISKNNDITMNILATTTKYIFEKYKDHSLIFTDESVKENFGKAGAVYYDQNNKN